MDVKVAILKSKEWVTLVACMVAFSMLAFAVFAMPTRGEAQLEHTPSRPAASVAPSTSPGTGATEPVTPTAPVQPTEPVQPTDPEDPMMHMGAVSQPSYSQRPVPPELKLNTFKRKDFGKSKGYITCKTEEYWLGVDVSVWQEEINWEKVAAAGFQFAMVRVAYRGWSRAGELNFDPRGQENLDGAAAAGLKVGVYVYSQATNVEEAIEEARYVLQLLDGRKLEMPIVFDWEVPTEAFARTRNVKAKTMQACAMAFCEEIKAAGYRPMVYFNQWQGSHQYDLAALREAGAELWLAMYAKAMTYTYQVQMWQYTGEGKVPGIKTKVDIDMYFPNH